MNEYLDNVTFQAIYSKFWGASGAICTPLALLNFGTLRACVIVKVLILPPTYESKKPSIYMDDLFDGDPWEGDFLAPSHEFGA